MRYAVFAVVLLTLVFLVELARLGMRIGKGLEISAASVPFEIKRPLATKTVLIVGDSTAVGTGAKSPQDSIAGRIAGQFPNTEIENRSRNGAKIMDVIEQLQGMGKQPFDLILIQAGGNDVLRFTPLQDLQNAVATMLNNARIRGEHVIFLSSGNVGLAPAFFPPITWIYTHRTRQARSIFLKVSEEKGIEYVDLFREQDNDPFYENPDKYYTPDYLHPGSEGYGYWYEEIKRQSTLLKILDPGSNVQ